MSTRVTEIVLLCSFHTALYVSAMLDARAPGLPITHVSSREELDAAFARPRPGARLIGYATGVIVPAAILDRLDGPAYNFHPGPPEYPGSNPVEYAVYDGAARFGVVAHEMVPRVDSGPIVATLAFDVPPDVECAWLHLRASQALAKLFAHMAEHLVAASRLSRTGAVWGTRRSTRALLDAMRELPADCPSHEFERRRRAFHTTATPLRTTIHGHRFTLAG